MTNDSLNNLGKKATTGRAMGTPRRPVFVRWSALSAVLLVFIGLASWYNVTIPLGEGPDESGHAEFVWWLARESGLPNVSEGDVLGEGHQPPLAYWLLQPAAYMVDQADRVVRLRANPNWIWNGGDEAPAFGRRSVDIWPFAAEARAWHIMRLLVTLISCITLIGIKTVAERLGLNWWTAVGAMGLVAVWPQFLFHSALVSNDPLLWCLITWCFAWLLRPRTGFWWGIMLGSLLGLTLLTKQNGMILLPMIAWISWRRRNNVQEWRRQMLEMGIATLLIAGWWYVRNFMLYGDFLGLNSYKQAFGSEAFQPSQLNLWLRGLSDLWSSAFGVFGWMNVTLPAVGYVLGAGIIGIALVGLWRNRTWYTREWHWAVSLLALTSAWIVGFAVISGMVAWQGRFLFPALASLASLLAVGLHQIEARGRVFRGVLLILLLLNSWIIGQLLPSIYGTQTVAAKIDAPLYGRWDPELIDGWELRGLHVRDHVQRGMQLDIDTLWTSEGIQNRDWSMFFHLAKVGEKYETVAFDLAPHYAATRWTKNDWWREYSIVSIPADIEPGLYELRLGWFDQFGTQQRAAVRTRDGTLLGDYMILETINVLP